MKTNEVLQPRLTIYWREERICIARNIVTYPKVNMIYETYDGQMILKSHAEYTDDLKKA